MPDTRIAAITGGARGMGRETAGWLARAGMTVAVLDLEANSATAAAVTLPGEGHVGYALDVSNESDVVAAFDRIESEVGPVAVLANFAGIFPWPADGRRPAIIDTSLDEWERTNAVNARGTFLTIREMLRRRSKEPVPHGRIVNISSSAAQLGGYNGSSAYVASKGAVLSLTKVAAREAAPLGITVNAIAPGAIDTPLLRAIMPPERDAAYLEKVPAGRIGHAADVAAAVAYLVSVEAGYVTGCCLDVNGGLRMQ
jgi:3-oxoacyl-[acyl-carrier protein] reductase